MVRSTPRLALVALLALPAASDAAITFNFTFQDVINNSNFGFDDPTHGATRRTTVESVGTYLNSVFNGDGAVDVHWQASLNNLGLTTLGRMSAFYPSAGSPVGYYAPAMAVHAFEGIDITGPSPDALGVINFGYNWNSDLSAPALVEYDLFTIVLHETMHGLGFGSLITSTGGYITGFEGVRSGFDKYLAGPGGSLLDDTGAFIGNVADLTSEAIVFNGPIATAANAGQPVPIYSPAPFESGSSLSHIGYSLDVVLNSGFSLGEAKRTLHPIELAMFQDMANATVPEPRDAAIALGAGLVLFAAVRRHQRRSSACPHSAT